MVSESKSVRPLDEALYVAGIEDVIYSASLAHIYLSVDRSQLRPPLEH